MTDRHTADTINDDDLDRLYVRLEGAEAAVSMVTNNATEWAKHEHADDPGEAAFAVAGRFLLTAMKLATRHAPVPAPTDQTALTDAERTMLTYALDQAQERIWSEDGFTDEDQAAVDSLRRRAVLPADQTTDRAAILRAEADRIDATREPFPIAVQNGITWATAELRRHAAKSAPAREA